MFVAGELKSLGNEQRIITMNNITQADLHRIYGTTSDLENNCRSAVSCWRDIKSFKTEENQIPYLPYVGSSYIGILFAGINLNGVMGSLTAIADLVEEAIEYYLKKEKYLIFKSKSYGGSPFYYYVPLLAYLYNFYTSKGGFIRYESGITFKQIIDGYRYCGLTNIIKCSVKSPNNRSTPSEAMYINCVKKFTQELDILKSKVLIVFTYFNLPRFANDYLQNYRIIKLGSRYRIQSDGNSYLLELEHPLSTQVTRADKFLNYSEAVFNLVQIMAIDTEKPKEQSR